MGMRTYALVSDLGDVSHDNFTMIPVWDIEVGVFVSYPGRAIIGGIHIG